jgi:hypothetical protein
MSAESLHGEGLVHMRDPDRLRDGPPINGQARWLVGIATAVSLLAAVWVSKAESGGVVPYAIYAGLNATPLLAPDVRTFIKVCRLGALLILLLGLFGIPFGLFYFWPAAGLLVLASHAAVGYGREPRLLMTSGALVGIIAAFAWGAAIYQTALRPANAYLVTFESPSAAKTAAGTGSASLTQAIGLGATRVSQKDSAWDVGFESHLSADQRTELEKRLWQLPGVSRVGLCSRWRGEC